MNVDAIYNFFNNPVTEDSVKALEGYIKGKDTKQLEFAFRILLNQISSDQQTSTLKSWEDRITDSNPQPVAKIRNSMYTAISAIQLGKRSDKADAVAHEAAAHVKGIIKSNEVMNATIIKVGGLVAFFFSVTYAGYVISKSKGVMIRIFDKVIKNIVLDLMRFGRVGGISIQ